MFKVADKQCDQCLFSANKIVSDERRRQLLEECDQRDTHFNCHKGTIKGVDICCRGFYDSRTARMIRMARVLNVVEFVKVD